MDPATRTLLQVVVEDAAIADDIFSRAHGRRRRVAQALHPGRTPRTSASSTSEASRTAHRTGSTASGDARCPTACSRRSRRTSSRSRSRRRWSAPSSTTRCRSSPRVRCPTSRDGLKPVHRRILYGMYERGLRPDRKHQKSRAAVGDVMGKYHPHGDQRDLRRARPHGPGLLAAVPARRRPRELRLARPQRPRRRRCATPRRGSRRSRCSCSARSTRTPSTSPPPTTARTTSRSCCRPRFPNLLVNGGGGIAVGMATNIPPHNLGEIIDADDPRARQPRRRRPTTS